MDGRRLLPLADTPPPERADAARNRRLLLEAASELVDRCDVDGVTMEAVAERAGVGKGTVFRRFESREGLMAALLDHTERAWQQQVMAGLPPLGPGAPPLERLRAFGPSRARTTMQHAALIRAAGRWGSRSLAAASFARAHVIHLLRELGVPGDRPYLATALLAPLEMPVLVQLLHEDGFTLDRVDVGWQALVDRLVASSTPAP